MFFSCRKETGREDVYKRQVLVLTGAHVLSAAQVGRGRHLKLRLEARGVPLDAIFFSADGGELGLTAGCRVDVAFYPQINEFRGLRSVQLQVVDLRRAMTRAQLEQSIYEKYRRGDLLTPLEAQSLLPTRAEFVCLWRYLKRQSAGQPILRDTVPRIARGAARSGGQPELPTHTLVCLEVMEERGPVSYTHLQGVQQSGDRLADLSLQRLLIDGQPPQGSAQFLPFHTDPPDFAVFPYFNGNGRPCQPVADMRCV